jgi:hypothetical protein
VGLPDKARRVVRGGSWNNDQANARAAYRNNIHPDNRNNNVGVRLSCLAHILAPLQRRRSGRLFPTDLLRACPPFRARAALPELAVDHGLRPEAKG